MKINITDEIRQEILDTLNRDTAKEYFEKLRRHGEEPHSRTGLRIPELGAEHGRPSRYV